MYNYCLTQHTEKCIYNDLMRLNIIIYGHCRMKMKNSACNLIFHKFRKSVW